MKIFNENMMTCDEMMRMRDVEIDYLDDIYDGFWWNFNRDNEDGRIIGLNDLVRLPCWSNTCNGLT